MIHVDENAPSWVNFAESKKRATEVIQALENKESYSPTFINGMYYGILISLNAEEQKEVDLQNNVNKLTNLSFIGRLKFSIKFLFTKKLL